jgi:hypothetical protein
MLSLSLAVAVAWCGGAGLVAGGGLVVLLLPAAMMAAGYCWRWLLPRGGGCAVGSAALRPPARRR